jgi:hypothetical protein
LRGTQGRQLCWAQRCQLSVAQQRHVRGGQPSKLGRTQRAQLSAG